MTDVLVLQKAPAWEHVSEQWRGEGGTGTHQDGGRPDDLDGLG